MKLNKRYKKLEQHLGCRPLLTLDNGRRKMPRKLALLVTIGFFWKDKVKRKTIDKYFEKYLRSINGVTTASQPTE